MLQLMNGMWKFSPWLLLITGVFSLLVGLRNLYAPDFLNPSHLSRADRRSLAPLYLGGGALCLVVGIGGLRRLKR